MGSGGVHRSSATGAHCPWRHLHLTTAATACPTRLSFSAGASGNSPEVISLAEEIVAHLRGLAGADAMLAACNQAREAVKSQRGERRRKEAMQVGGVGCLAWGVLLLDSGRVLTYPAASRATLAHLFHHPPTPTCPYSCPRLPPRSALQTLVDPEAAAKRKIRKQQRKASGKRKQLEHVKRLRSSGVAVKNKKARTDGGRGGRGSRE